MDVSQPQLRVVTEALTAIKEDAMTKITLSDSRVYGWSSQDIIAVSVNQGGSYSFVESTAYSASKFAVTHGGTRTGYAVLPSSFAKSYNGSTLTVTYPESYDISADISAGRYDNANGSAYIPFPMVVLFPDGYVDQTDLLIQRRLEPKQLLISRSVMTLMYRWSVPVPYFCPLPGILVTQHPNRPIPTNGETSPHMAVIGSTNPDLRRLGVPSELPIQALGFTLITTSCELTTAPSAW